MRKSVLFLAAALGMGAFISPGLAYAAPAVQTANTTKKRRGLFNSRVYPTAIGYGRKAAGGSVARDKRAAVKVKNRKANRRNHG